MTQSWPGLACALVLTLSVCAPPMKAQEKLSPKQVSKIRELSASTLAKEGLPGLAVAVSKGNQVWSAGFGSADLEQGVPVNSQSMFRAASIAKWMTAPAAMRLEEDGKLNIDASVQEYCPDYPRKQWTITSRELMTQLSGVRHYHGANGEPRDTGAQRDALDVRTRRE